MRAIIIDIAKLGDATGAESSFIFLAIDPPNELPHEFVRIFLV